MRNISVKLYFKFGPVVEEKSFRFSSRALATPVLSLAKLFVQFGWKPS